MFTPFPVLLDSRDNTNKSLFLIDFVNHQHDPKEIENLTMQRAFAEKWSALDPAAKVSVVPSIEEAINTARSLAETELKGEDEKVHALITGSLHLVGGALQILENADAL